MRVLVAGSSGVLGRQVVPVLRGAGHEVVGLARRPDADRGVTGQESRLAGDADEAGPVRRPAADVDADGRHRRPVAGVDHEVVVADALDPAAVDAVVRRAKPDAVVHLLTAIPPRLDPRRLAAQFALTNRLRTEGTRNLLDAARRAGAARVITQGLAYGYRPGPGPAGEDDPLWTDGPAQFRPVAAALAEHERQTAAAGGLVLRFGHLYGPGTAFAADGSFTADVRAGKVPLVGGGHAVFSFTHTRDAAMAVLAALDRDVSGPLNIVDDTPTPLAQWLPEFARLLGAPRPRTAPAWLARLAVGGWGVAFLNELRGADNARARLLLDWRPGYRSWRDGFAAEL